MCKCMYVTVFRSRWNIYSNIIIITLKKEDNKKYFKAANKSNPKIFSLFGSSPVFRVFLFLVYV